MLQDSVSVRHVWADGRCLSNTFSKEVLIAVHIKPENSQSTSFDANNYHKIIQIHPQLISNAYMLSHLSENSKYQLVPSNENL